MLFSIMPSALNAPPVKSHELSSFHRLPTLKNLILVPGSVSNFRLGRSLRASDSRDMAEVVSVGTFGSGGRFQVDGSGEADAVLGNGSSHSSWKPAWVDVESTLNRMSKWVVAALFGIVILWKHDAEVLWAAMGSVVNSWLSITLKQIINHQRPASALRSDPGMPSSHAQSIFYAAAFAILSLVHWLGVNIFTVMLGTAILACGSYLSWLRVSQQLHTISQILVGAVLGSTCGITWFWLWNSFVWGAFISSVWVRILVVFGSVAFCAAFLLYVIRNWLKDEL
ncbi:lipid phosphate phosphatase epsilon 2, chloroplastic-like [Typha angustifolia]|uniref:lipid phosphate phosphatase epsilon 2, chloroplastic-like n=1 Tax=Typha angustifolia TaxID=59011 RepID=UPI003C2B038B